MNIALFGYGKMGKMIEQIALDRGHTLVAKIDGPYEDLNYSEMDVAIDFSLPEVAFDNITNCLNNGVPIISGTTGWLDKYDEAVALCKEKQGAFIYASNFSLGVNIFFGLNEYLAKAMGRLEDYQVSMEEIHHTQKLDAPSGTAITLAEDVIKHSSHYGQWELDRVEQEASFPIKAIREGEVPGTHTVAYSSAVDSIQIKHTAHNRQGFALGAVVAAEWIQDKTGTFSMRDVLGM